MKASATIFYNQIFNFFRARCITKDYLLTQNYHRGNQTSQSDLNGTVIEESVIHLLNGGLGTTDYFMS